MNRVVSVCTFIIFITCSLSLADEKTKESRPIERETRTINGWTVRIDKRLLKKEPKATKHALGLLKNQLVEIIQVVPQPAVTTADHRARLIFQRAPHIGPRRLQRRGQPKN